MPASCASGTDVQKSCLLNIFQKGRYLMTIKMKPATSARRRWKRLLTREQKILVQRYPMTMKPDYLVAQCMETTPFFKRIPDMEMDFGWLIPKNPDSLGSGHKFKRMAVVANRKTKKVLLCYGCNRERPLLFCRFLLRCNVQNCVLAKEQGLRDDRVKDCRLRQAGQIMKTG